MTSTHQMPHDSAADRVLDDLERYWLQLRGANRLPARTDLDPARIDAALPHSMILDAVAPGVARIRVCGAAVARTFGDDPRGLPLSLFFHPEARAALDLHLRRVFGDGRIVELGLHAPRTLLRRDCRGRLKLLPMTDTTGAPTKALAVLVLDDGASEGGRRFHIAPEAPLRCQLPPHLIAVPGPRPVAAGFAPAESEGPAPVRRPALRLVVSNP